MNDVTVTYIAALNLGLITGAQIICNITTESKYSIP